MPAKKPASKPWTDPDDAPELTEDAFARGVWTTGNEPPADLAAKADAARRGGRPKSDNPKQQVTLRLDADVLQHFRATGRGWQTRVNEALRHASGLDNT